MKTNGQTSVPTTENLILEAARQVFLDKGLEGSRMQEIADRAGINKALLHYYFRNKQKLFEHVFESVIASFFPQVLHLIGSNKSVPEKIRQFVSIYLDVIYENPFIPRFIIHEMNRDPAHLTTTMERIAGKDIRKQLKKLDEDLAEASQRGIIRPVNAEHLVINMLSLCIFPVVAEPIIAGILFHKNEAEYKQFLLTRKELVAEFIINGLKC
ncbi:MAG TPA: TetR/AcrR family transcriptional regulator [Bacteroidales bacterium]|nr:TetR/AcrR family transcriptional regulator [Bacteroidales bacterium]